MKDLILVQPHSDDILFSSSKFLFEADNYKSVTILTFENNPKRILEDEKLKEFFPKINVETFNVDYIDSTHSYFKTHNEIEETAVLNYLTLAAGGPVLSDFIDSWERYIKRKRKASKQLEIVTCLGIGHPFHWFVNSITANDADLFYREFPHSYKRRNANQLANMKKNGYELAFEHDDKDQHELKFQIASKVYRSQSGLLFYEQGKIKKQYPEEFFKKIN